MLSRNEDELYGMRVASKKHYISTAKVFVRPKHLVIPLSGSRHLTTSAQTTAVWES